MKKSTMRALDRAWEKTKQEAKTVERRVSKNLKVAATRTRKKGRLVIDIESVQPQISVDGETWMPLDQENLHELSTSEKRSVAKALNDAGRELGDSLGKELLPKLKKLSKNLSARVKAATAATAARMSATGAPRPSPFTQTGRLRSKMGPDPYAGVTPTQVQEVLESIEKCAKADVVFTIDSISPHADPMIGHVDPTGSPPDKGLKSLVKAYGDHPINIKTDLSRALGGGLPAGKPDSIILDTEGTSRRMRKDLEDALKLNLFNPDVFKEKKDA